MYTNKLIPSSKFPDIKLKQLSGEEIDLLHINNGADWKLIAVYRGQHCPMCTKYLNELEGKRREFLEIGVDIIAISGDSKSQLQSHMERLKINFSIAYGLTQQQMQTLGLYISLPRSEKETDHNFSEPGLFIVNQEGNLQVVDISNNPFVRPNLDELLSGLRWIRNPENNYPIRGTFCTN